LPTRLGRDSDRIKPKRSGVKDPSCREKKKSRRGAREAKTRICKKRRRRRKRVLPHVEVKTVKVGTP